MSERISRMGSIASAAIAVAAFVMAALVPSGEPITIDNRGLLGPFDPSGPDPAFHRTWLRLLVLGVGIAVALIVRAIDRHRRSASLAWASGVVILTAILVALAYPTGPSYPPPGACLPGGRLGPTASQCLVYYSDHQPGPTHMPLRLVILAVGVSVGFGLVVVARRTTRGSVVVVN